MKQIKGREWSHTSPSPPTPPAPVEKDRDWTGPGMANNRAEEPDGSSNGRTEGVKRSFGRVNMLTFYQKDDKRKTK
jgi:hypothetical protein